MAAQDFERVREGLLPLVERLVVNDYGVVFDDPSKPAAYRWIRYEDPDPIGRLHLATRRLDAASDGKSPAADADLEEALAVAKELGYREHRRPG